MDELKAKWKKRYTDLVKTSKEKVLVSGRNLGDAEKEENIWQDILNKLQLREAKARTRIFDIGCGFSNVASRLIEESQRMNWDLWVMDIPEIIEALHTDMSRKFPLSYVHFLPGLFPEDFTVNAGPREGFDVILIYSVLHYTSQPMALVQAAIKLLAPEGRLLIGDIPNVNKKGRFLASKAGRQFDAAYKKIPVEETPVFETHHEFVKQQPNANLLNDEFLHSISTKYRDLGFDVFIVPQPSTLPFCYTREDMIVVRHD